MDNSNNVIDAYNGIAQDWARNQSARLLTVAPAPRGARPRGAVPVDRALQSATSTDHDTAARGLSSWPDSALDLHDGLSVVDVYADPDPATVAPFTLDLGSIRR